MTWRDVLRRDLRSVYRSRLGPVIGGLLLLVTVGIVSVMWFLAPSDHPPEMRDAVLVLGSVLSFIVPLVALLGTYSAIVGERMTGSVRFLLGLPNTRDGALFGKFCSRGVMVLVPLTVGILGAAAVVALMFDDGSFAGILLLGAAAALYGVLFIGAGLSASVVGNSDTQAVALVVGVFVLFRAVWPAIQWAGLQSMIESYPRPEWYFWVGRTNPINAFVRVTTALADVEFHPLLTRPDELQGLVVSLEFALVVLVGWTVVAPLIGVVYFRRRDLL